MHLCSSWSTGKGRQLEFIHPLGGDPPRIVYLVACIEARNGAPYRDDRRQEQCRRNLFYADNPSERLNLPDTLKAQHIARLTTGSVLYSDMGRILCSITGGTLGWHDPLGGCSDAALVEKKYGKSTYQTAKNDWYQNALDGFLIELAKYGLNSRDLMMNVNFFSKVEVSEDGSMHFIQNHSTAGSTVELRAEMNTLVILNTCQHPMDREKTYAQRPVKLTVKKVEAPGLDDVCRNFRPENGRGFTLTERYFL